jgi:hypothetical protein
MLKNYRKLPNGVIEQIEKDIIPYDKEYVEQRYNTYGELGLRMAYLRLGHIIGSIGHIPNSIMDIGYGNGDFLKTCKEIIPECFGSDVSGYPLPPGVSYVDSFLDQEVDVITMYDVLEHFEDINIIKHAKCKYMCVSLPWCHYDSDEWFENWKHRRPNEHLWHFNDKSLVEFFNQNGYELINSSPIEDTIRKPSDNKPNILTAIFKKIQ